MTRAVSLQILKPVFDHFSPGDGAWPVIAQAAADSLYDDLGSPAADALTDGQYAALTDLIVIAGINAFTGSAIERLIKAGNLAMATYEFEKWVIGPDPVTGEPGVLRDLVLRRQVDKAIWLA